MIMFIKNFYIWLISLDFVIYFDSRREDKGNFVDEVLQSTNFCLNFNISKSEAY